MQPTTTSFFEFKLATAGSSTLTFASLPHASCPSISQTMMGRRLDRSMLSPFAGVLRHFFRFFRLLLTMRPKHCLFRQMNFVYTHLTTEVQTYSLLIPRIWCLCGKTWAVTCQRDLMDYDTRHN
jgi:hypothetical protein